MQRWGTRLFENEGDFPVDVSGERRSQPRGVPGTITDVLCDLCIGGFHARITHWRVMVQELM